MRFRISGVSMLGEAREVVVVAEEAKAALQQARAQGVFPLACVQVREKCTIPWRRRAVTRLLALWRPGYWRWRPLRIISVLLALLVVGLWIESNVYLDYFETPQWAHCSFNVFSVHGAAEITLIYANSGTSDECWRGVHQPVRNGTEFRFMQTRGHWYTLWLGVRHMQLMFDPSGRTVHFYSVGVPYGLLLGLFIGAAFWPFWPYRRHYGKGLCPACGYDLRATPQRCPECGRHVETGEPANTSLSTPGSDSTNGGQTGRA